MERETQLRLGKPKRTKKKKPETWYHQPTGKTNNRHKKKGPGDKTLCSIAAQL
jgi:hypothetical protein